MSQRWLNARSEHTDFEDHMEQSSNIDTIVPATMAADGDVMVVVVERTASALG